MREACEKAKIVYGRDVEGGFVFHDVRRTAVTNVRRSGRVDIETAAAYFGHSVKVMLAIYSKTDPQRQRLAASVLEESGPNLPSRETLTTNVSALDGDGGNDIIGGNSESKAAAG